MLPLVLTMLAAQATAPASAPPGSGAVVLVVRHEGLSAIESAALSEKLAKALGDSGIPLTMSPEAAATKLGARNPETCRNKPPCLAELGRALRAAVVVALDSGRILDEFAVRIVVVDSREGRTLFDRGATVSADRPKDLDAMFGKAAAQISLVTARLPGFAPAEARKPPESTPVREGTASRLPDDAPRVEKSPGLVPAPSEPDVMAEAPSPVPRYVTGGGAIAGGVAAVAFAVVGAVNYSDYHQKVEVPATATVPRSTAEQMARNVNQSFLLAGIFAGVAAALGVTTFLLAPPAAPAP